MAPIKLQSNATADDSDGDVSGGESDRSNTSRENDGGRDSSDVDEVESDDSSEMDEKECEARRNQCMENLTDLEEQFSMLREQLYKERSALIDHELSEIRSERSPDYLVRVSNLKQNMTIRTEVAGILRQYRLNNIQHTFDAEEQAALQHLNSEKSLARDFYEDELNETIRKLEEDRHNVEINWGEGGEWCSRSRSRSRRKAVTVSGPYIVYMLKPQDIIDDWTTIRKALKRTT